VNLRSLLAAPAAAILATAGAARAQEPPFAARAEPPFVAHAEPPFAAHAEGTRVGLQADVWPGHSFVVATMGLGAQIAVGKRLGLDIDVPWAFGGARDAFTFQQEGHAVFGNVTLGVHGVLKPAESLALIVGASVSIPTRLSFSGSSSRQLSFQSAVAASRGFFDAHRFGPEVVFVRAPLGIEGRAGRIVYYRGELTPSMWIPAGDQVQTHAVQLLLEQAEEIELRAPFGFGGGFRFQAAFALTSAIAFGFGDRAQTALEPFVGFEPPGAGLYGRLGLFFALDRPAGFGFEKDRLASLRMQVGGKF
jgi:hypothetical protein